MPRQRIPEPELQVRSVSLTFNCAGLTREEQDSFTKHFYLTLETHPLCADAKGYLRTVSQPACAELLTNYRVIANHSSDVAGILIGKSLLPLMFQLRRTAITRLAGIHAVNAKGSEQ